MALLVKFALNPLFPEFCNRFGSGADIVAWRVGGGGQDQPAAASH